MNKREAWATRRVLCKCTALGGGRGMVVIGLDNIRIPVDLSQFPGAGERGSHTIIRRVA